MKFVVNFNVLSMEVKQKEYYSVSFKKVEYWNRQLSFANSWNLERVHSVLLHDRQSA